MVIYESKLRLPNNFIPLLKRKRLFSFLERNLHRTLICITSEGGFGKTTLVSSFLKELKIPFVWYQLTQIDRNPLSFLTYFKTAIARKMSGKDLIYSIEEEQMEEEFEKIISILATWPTPLLIVLDDYQSIDQSLEVENMLSKMITNASPSIHFIITSRVRPNLQLVKLKLQNRLAELKTDDLAFTKEEIRQFFCQLHGLNLYDHEVEIIYQKTEGWATSLQLLLDFIKDLKEEERSSFWAKFNGTPDINDYLSAEILASQPDDICQFLYKTCLLTELNSFVINKFLEIDNAGEIIQYLSDRHLFLYKTNLGNIKYHNLFRSFLYKELLKRHSKSEIDRFHQKLSKIYEQKADFINAFAHSVLGNHFVDAVKLMKSMKERFTPTQYLSLIEKLLQNFSPDLTSASISLFLFRCIPLKIMKELAIQLEINYKSMKEQISQVFITHFQHQLASIYFFLGNLKKSEQYCDESLETTRNLKDDELLSKNLSLKALLCWKKGELEEAKKYAQCCLSIPGTYNNFHPHFLSLWILSEVYLEQNELEKGETIIKETLKLSEQRFDCSVIYPYCTIGKLHRIKGNYEEAFSWIQKAEDIASDLNLEYDLGNIYIEKVLTYMETKKWDEAENYLEKAKKHVIYNQFLTNKIDQLQEQLSGEKGGILTQSMRVQDLKMESSIKIFEKKPILFVYTLGNFEIKREGVSVTLKRKSSLRLFQYFIANRNRKITKDSIIDEVFPEGSMDSVNNQFYVSLSYLRKALEPNLKSGRDSQFIQQSGEHYIFNIDSVYIDAEEFVNLFQSKDNLTFSERIKYLKKAEKLYQGDYFQEYPYVSFLELERENLKVFYLKILKEMAIFYWDQGNYQQGMEYFEKAIQKDPYEESIYEQYIKRLLEANLLLQAKKVSKEYEKFVEKELGIPVQTKIQTMFQQYGK